MKIYIKILVVVLVFFVSFQVTLAAFGNIFGGRITNLKALQIEKLEEAGYDCEVPGSTIEIRSIKGPTAYFTPQNIVPKTKTIPAMGAAIIGKYNGKTDIICRKGDSIQIVILDTIIFFGTSRR